MKDSAPIILELCDSTARIQGGASSFIGEIVHVGEDSSERSPIVGEVSAIHGNELTIQLFEHPQGLRPGDPVTFTGASSYVTLGPGLGGTIFDGLQRRYDAMECHSSTHVGTMGFSPSWTSPDRWQVSPDRREGDTVERGAPIATCHESDGMLHRILLPPHVGGLITRIVPPGTYGSHDPIATVEDDSGMLHEIGLHHSWPTDTPRPVRRRRRPERVLEIGLPIVDTLFPIMEGSSAIVTGQRGAGKTSFLHHLGSNTSEQMTIFISCGQRSADLQYRAEGLSSRTMMVAATSDMPFPLQLSALRTGLTCGEYFRDQGFSVLMVVDGLTAWADGHRNEGFFESYPSNLPALIAGIFRRSSAISTAEGTTASLTIIATVDERYGSDGSNPVLRWATEATDCRIALGMTDWSRATLPIVNPAACQNRYDSGSDNLSWSSMREKALRILREAENLSQMKPHLTNRDLSPRSRLVLEASNLMVQTLSSFEKQNHRTAIEGLVLSFDEALRRLEAGASIDDVVTKLAADPEGGAV